MIFRAMECKGKVEGFLKGETKKDLEHKILIFKKKGLKPVGSVFSSRMPKNSTMGGG